MSVNTDKRGADRPDALAQQLHVDPRFPRAGRVNRWTAITALLAMGASVAGLLVDGVGAGTTYV